MENSPIESYRNMLTESLRKSLRDNSQLVFAKKLTIAITSSQDKSSFPLVEIVDITDIATLSNEEDAIFCLFDNRTNFFNELSKTSNAKLSIYFPLSREKFIMNARVKIINSIENEEILMNYWRKLNQEEKLQYETVDKDSIKPSLNECDDLNKYIAQEEMKYSKNFAIGLFTPIEGEYTIFPMPQVVANTRKQKFESLLKPHKMPQKFLIQYDKFQSKWISKKLN